MGKIIRNGINYGGTYEDATSVNYDGSASELNAHTVQEGIDEVQSNVNTINDSLNGLFKFASGFIEDTIPATGWKAITFNIPIDEGYYAVAIKNWSVSYVAQASCFNVTVNTDGSITFNVYNPLSTQQKVRAAASVLIVKKDFVII